MSDEALLAGLAMNEVALAFVRRFQGHVYAVAMAIVGDRPAAEDVTQIAFEKAWQKASTFDAQRGNVRTWLTAVTRNVALDAIRRRRPDPVDPTDLVRLLGPGPEQTEEVTVRNESRAELQAAIRRLPPEQARALVMAGVYRMTAQEVAESEGIPLGTAKTRIRAAMIKLRELLASAEVTND
ncbi:MAG TPA: sigma-70 family RNA polymerase sigma factor [Acidimicrobiales bacterium]|nr:sigma-70 family RNA polymerase sigma factor [Acidimicrobiales bacterium]